MAFDSLKKKLGQADQPEVMGPPSPDAPSLTESALRGAAQGATFGQAPRIAGMMDAAPELYKAATGESDLASVYDKYKQGKEESEKAFEAAEEANPKMSIAGGLVGGALPGLFSGGAGEGAALARLAGKGAQAAKGAEEAISGASALAKIKAMAAAAKEAKEAEGLVSAAKGAVPYVGKNMAKAPVMESQLTELGGPLAREAMAKAEANGIAREVERQAAQGLDEKVPLTMKELRKATQKLGRAIDAADRHRATFQTIKDRFTGFKEE